MLFVPLYFADLADEVCGIWTRVQLEEMDREFCARVEAAFAAKLESRAAAAATYTMNGKQRTDELAIELAWRWFRDAKFGATAVKVLARCPGVAPERVREGLWRRLRSGMSKRTASDDLPRS
jgi:hypothetical protein